MTGTPSGPEVARFLNTSAFAREMVWEEELVSTNTTARVLAGKGAAEGLVVSADRQTGGRGRLGRSWESAPGVNIHCSLVLRPRVPLQRIPQLTLLVAVAIHKAIASLLPDLSAAIKWPNDIYSDGRKLAGVLCEMESEADCAHFVVVGIGINVNQESFSPIFPKAPHRSCLPPAESRPGRSFWRRFSTISSHSTMNGVKLMILLLCSTILSATPG